MSSVKQISIFLENKCGRLVNVTNILSKYKINIRALTIADTSDFGILRVIVDQPDKACKILRGEGFMASLTDIVAVEVPDHVGGLADVLKYLEDENVNIEYLYSFVEKPGQDALIFMRLEDTEKALQVLKEKNVKTIDGERIYSL